MKNKINKLNEKIKEHFICFDGHYFLVISDIAPTNSLGTINEVAKQTDIKSIKAMEWLKAVFPTLSNF